MEVKTGLLLAIFLIRIFRIHGDMTGVLVLCTFANTPVVSPDNKKPRQAGFQVFSSCRFTSLPSWRSSAKHVLII